MIFILMLTVHIYHALTNKSRSLTYLSTPAMRKLFFPQMTISTFGGFQILDIYKKVSIYITNGIVSRINFICHYKNRSFTKWRDVKKKKKKANLLMFKAGGMLQNVEAFIFIFSYLNMLYIIRESIANINNFQFQFSTELLVLRTPEIK